MQVCITVDVEHDCPPFLTSVRGIEQGIPLLLALLEEEAVAGTFFTTGDVARRFPDTVRRIVDSGHELGCHGDTHARFSALEPHAALGEITRASEVLRTFYPVTSFRAPNLDFPSSYLPFLRDAGYRLDSSQGRHKPGSLWVAPHTTESIRRVPATTAPSVLRLPRVIRNAVLRRLASPAVFFFHPWEFVDMTRTPIPLDCRFRTGDPALASVRETIRHYRARGATFHRMQDLPA
jgi:peptidoglycan/xylan/chitin deacetylase (PgdA/CDA1 family)